MIKIAIFILFCILNSILLTEEPKIKINEIPKKDEIKVPAIDLKGINQVQKEVQKLEISSVTFQQRVFTIDELKQYNGKDGKPVYVAVDGIVYDLSDAKPWKTGKHQGMHTAGEDLTDAFKKAPKEYHIPGITLEKYPKVGILVNENISVKIDTITIPVLEDYNVPNSDYGKKVICPVTGRRFRVFSKTTAVKYQDKIYYFYNTDSFKKFKKNPEKYIKK